VFEPMDALRIVRKRGELMFEAGLKQPGTMAAIIGLDTDVVEGLCGDVSREGSVVVVANINSPGQVVVSGHIDAVERAVEAATAGGAKKALKLNVSGAFHSPLVAPAQDELAGYISEFNMSDSGIDVICNVDAAAVRDSGQIKDALSRQLTSPVRWLDSMKLLSDGWEGGIIEAGPGKVLSGLMKRIDRERPVELAGTAEQVKKILASADAMK
jgi:[acyl-carrier-protein] S-malonyltransferase